jgi:arylformamidase
MVVDKVTARLIDVSPKLREDMPTYPGNPPFKIRQVRTVEEGANSTLSEVTTGTHAGTHVDAPSHFIAGERSLEDMGLEPLVGRARVIAVDADDEIAVSDLEPHSIEEGERILLKTRNSMLWERSEFVKDYVFLSVEAARYLAGKRLACLGIDYLSVGGKGNGVEVHQALLGAGVMLVEGLDLTEADPGEYDFVCLPLRLADAEAAPSRAVLRPLE